MMKINLDSIMLKMKLYVDERINDIEMMTMYIIFVTLSGIAP